MTAGSRSPPMPSTISSPQRGPTICRPTGRLAAVKPQGTEAAGRPASVSAMALGWPGRLMISALPRITATWRDRIAVGTKVRLIWRICSPKPGMVLCATASVASGVTSRGAGPVPPHCLATTVATLKATFVIKDGDKADD